MAALNKNDRLMLDITALDAQGRGIARNDGMVVFVPGALPGESVNAHIVKVTAKYAVGKLMDIERLSPKRVEPLCAHFPQCGGCQLQHMSYPAQLEHKQRVVADALTRIGGMPQERIEPIIGCDQPWHYRNKGAFPAGMIDAQPSLGLFAARSHRLIGLQDCPLHSSVIERARKCVEGWMRQRNIAPYDETADAGDIRHMVARCDAQGQKCVVVLVARRREVPHLDDLIHRLQCEDGMIGLAISINGKRGNSIMGSGQEALWGQIDMEMILGEVKFLVSPQSFFQVNTAQTVNLYRLARDYAELEAGDTLVDAFCGVGTIGQFMARDCRQVTGLESIAKAVENARHNAKLNDLDNCRYIAGDANALLADWAQWGAQPDVIVADPPRKGVDERFIEAVARSGARRLVYVSCHPGTLARDIALFAGKGYTAIQARAVDMFPQTNHVETVCLMSKKQYNFKQKDV